MPNKRSEKKRHPGGPPHGGGIPQPRAIIEQRRDQVARLLLMGFKDVEIARSVQAPVGTVRRDISVAWVRIKRIYETRRIEYLAALESKVDELWHQGWLLFLEQVELKEKGFFGRLAALNYLRLVASLMGRLGMADRTVFTDIAAVMAPTWQGVKITSARQVEDIIRGRHTIRRNPSPNRDK